MSSISENLQTPGLPDVHQAVTWWRALGFVNLAALLAALAANRDWFALPGEVGRLLLFVEPVALLGLALMTFLHDWLSMLSRWQRVMLRLLLILLVTAAVHGLLVALHWTAFSLGRAALWSALGIWLIPLWCELIARSEAPALMEARLLALTARIRPHFLFNALNGVLGVIRSDPRRAETALEELADLFRVLMRENTDLVPLSEEIAVARQYLDLERLRLGERMQVTWDMENCPPDPLVPPLLLQPLLENAVYHGIEPSSMPGDIDVRIERVDDRVRIELSNPLVATQTTQTTRRGHQMALTNIRERLLLFFGLEAVMATGVRDGRFRVFIEFPYRAASR